MRFNAGRLRRGELIAGGGGILLFVLVFFVPWFAASGHAPRLASSHRATASLDGWHALTTTRWILLLTIAASIALVLLTAMRRAPAVPVTLSMLSCVLGALSSLTLVYRIIHHPGLSARGGVYAGLAVTLIIGYGGYLALRTEGSAFGDPRSIDAVRPERSRSGASGTTESSSAGCSGP